MPPEVPLAAKESVRDGKYENKINAFELDCPFDRAGH